VNDEERAPLSQSAPIRRVRVSVPATSANLGPGFDALGVALSLRAEVTLSLAAQPAAPKDRGEAMALEAAGAVFAHLGRAAPPLAATIASDVPVARGLGASAIVRVGAAVAAAVLAGGDHSGEALLPIVAALEQHADNAAPALFGGLQVVVWDPPRIEHVRVPVPRQLRAVIFVPEFEMSTDESRKLLPATLSRTDAVSNAGRAALLVAALAAGRLDALGTATADRLHQPARAKLFPAMYQLFEAATRAGAACAYLSGGGSAILAMTDGDPAAIEAAMLATARDRGVDGSTLVAEFSERGAEILDPPEPELRARLESRA
jgi:homoserine kinase